MEGDHGMDVGHRVGQERCWGLLISMESHLPRASLLSLLNPEEKGGSETTLS